MSHMEKLANLRKRLDKEYYKLKYTPIPNNREFQAVGSRTMMEIAGLRETVINFEFILTTLDREHRDSDIGIIDALTVVFLYTVKPDLEKFYQRVYDYSKGKK